MRQGICYFHRGLIGRELFPPDLAVLGRKSGTWLTVGWKEPLHERVPTGNIEEKKKWECPPMDCLRRRKGQGGKQPRMSVCKPSTTLDAGARTDHNRGNEGNERRLELNQKRANKPATPGNYSSRKKKVFQSEPDKEPRKDPKRADEGRASGH